MEARGKRWWRRALPVVSLLMGVASALTMDRRPERAWMVALAAGAGWLALGAFALLDRVARAAHAEERPRSWLARAAHASASLGAQSLLQWCLFFAVPFYAQAAATTLHWGFVALLVVAGLLTLWPPLAEWILRHPLAGAGLQAVGGRADFAPGRISASGWRRASGRASSRPRPASVWGRSARALAARPRPRAGPRRRRWR
jgi:hypothetical protein